MSSHHIVREKQEPALLILGLDNFSDELLGQLLEWSPTVIVTELIAEKLNTYGIKIDWVIADVAGDIQSDIKFMPVKADSIIDTAFDFLIANSYSAVNMVTDELDINDYLPYWDKINLVIFHNQKKIYPVVSGFSKWKPGGETIGLLTRSDSLKVVGLQTCDRDEFITTTDGMFSIQFNNPFLFIAENLQG